MVLKVIRIAETTSTQDAAADYVRFLESQGLEIPLLSAVSADYQTAGRGRLGQRRWEAEAGQSILLTVALNVGSIPLVAPQLCGWFPLVTSRLMIQAIEEQVNGGEDLAIGLKWPNDVLVGEKKLAGVLCVLMPSPPNVVLVGSGVNVLQNEPPYPGATSLWLELEKRGKVSNYPALKEAIEKRYLELCAAAVEWLSRAVVERPGEIIPRAHRYVSQSLISIGRSIRAELPGHSAIVGTAQRLGHDGALVVRVIDRHTGQVREERITAATVTHAGEREGSGIGDLRAGHGTDEGEATN